MRESFIRRAISIFFIANIRFGNALDPRIPPITLQYDRQKNVLHSYLVQLTAGTSLAASALHHEWLRELTLGLAEGTDLELAELPTAQTNVRHEHGFKGVTDIFDLNDGFRAYTIHTNEFVAARIREHPEVHIIERESYVYADPQPLHSGACNANDRVDHLWGLGRLSHQDHENTSWPYSYSSEGQGQGVDVYVLDTGIFAEHQEFGGRVTKGESFVPGEETTEDFVGHGTHCAGTIAGANVGVAKLATLIPVKVLAKSGPTVNSVLIKGMKWVHDQHQQKLRQVDPTFRGSVVSISVGGSFSKVLNNMANSLVGAGLHVVTAAGNEHVDSCTSSPAASRSVTTVGAVDWADQFAPFSNFGSCVDIQAPGVDITSACHLDKTGYAVFSGTSQACPHVAGVIATLLSRVPVQGTEAWDVEKITPKQLKADLLHIMTKSVINQSTLPTNTTDGIVYNGGPRSNYADIVDRGGWPECCI